MATSDDTGSYIGTSDTTQPEDTDNWNKGAAEIRQAKTQAQNTFPNLTGAVTVDQAEINRLSGVTSDIQPQINSLSSSKADKLTGATAGNVPTLDVNGNLSGQIDPASFAHLAGAETFTGHKTFTERSDTTFALAGIGTAAVDPANGHIQYATVTGALTITDSLTDGQAVRLVLTNGGSNVTWPAGIVWMGGSAPTLQASGTDKVILTKIGTTLYGAAFTAPPVTGPTLTAPVAISARPTILVSSLPASATSIYVMLRDIDATGGTTVIQLGTAGGLVTSGYVGSNNSLAVTTGFAGLSGSNKASGMLHLKNVSGNIWLASGVFAYTDTAGTESVGGYIDLGAELTQIGVTSTGNFVGGLGSVEYQ